MNKTTFLTYTVAALIILNLFTIGFISLRDKNNRKEPMPKDVVIHKLHFDEAQIKQYLELINAHKNKISLLDDSIKNVKNELYSHLSQPITQSDKDSLFKSLARYQEEIEQTHYNHFLEIKGLCKPNQLKDFNNLTKELSKIFGKKPPRKIDEK